MTLGERQGEGLGLHVVLDQCASLFFDILHVTLAPKLLASSHGTSTCHVQSL